MCWTYETLSLIKPLRMALWCRNMQELAPYTKCFKIYFIAFYLAHFVRFVGRVAQSV